MTTTEIGAFRRDGPDSMTAGAFAVAPKLSTLQARVLALFLERRELTDEELVALYTERWGSCEYRSIGTRRKELVKQELIADTGRRRPSKSNVRVIVWGLTGAAPVSTPPRSNP